MLLIWLLTSIVGIHAHLCFDGEESPVTFHFSDLEIDSHHTIDHDVDIAQVKSLQSKFFKVDLTLLLLIFLCLSLPSLRQIFNPVWSLNALPSRWAHLRPLLRAPPVSSAR
ncbi:MAG TPA: hypothetical protein VFV48_02030 [Pseudomonadales bacterium]|nr:hypothetical protein [Pseudomonadales bacterium]